MPWSGVFCLLCPDTGSPSESILQKTAYADVPDALKCAVAGFLRPHPTES